MSKESEWFQEFLRMESEYPALKAFLETWAENCGASRATFSGHTCKMVNGVLAQYEGTVRPWVAVQNAPLEVLRARCPKLEEDFLMALRFLYYVAAKPAIPDAMYDEAEKEYLARPEVDDSPLLNPGSDNPKDYPEHVKALAFYISTVGWQGAQEAGPEPKKPKRKSKRVEAEDIGDLFPELK